MPTLAALCLLSLTQIQPAGGLTNEDMVALTVEALQWDVRREGASMKALGEQINVLPDPVVARNVDRILRTRMGAYLRGLAVTCSAGRVTLSGMASDASMRTRAGLMADGVVGAREVQNLLATPDSPGETWTAPPPIDTGPAESEPFDFLTADGLCGAGVVVVVANGVIQLEDGIVGSIAARDYAQQCAQIVPGSRAVENYLEVLQTSKGNDERTAIIISKRLSFTPALHSVVDGGRDASGRARAGQGIQVVVRLGVCQVSGTVLDQDQADLIEAFALAADAVLVVDNRLQVAPRRGRR